MIFVFSPPTYSSITFFFSNLLKLNDQIIPSLFKHMSSPISLLSLKNKEIMRSWEEKDKYNDHTILLIKEIT